MFTHHAIINDSKVFKMEEIGYIEQVSPSFSVFMPLFMITPKLPILKTDFSRKTGHC